MLTGVGWQRWPRDGPDGSKRALSATNPGKRDNVVRSYRSMGKNMKAILFGILAAFGCVLIPSFGTANAAPYTEKVLYAFCNQSQCADGRAPTAA
jgi:hypothetical protein